MNEKTITLQEMFRVIKKRGRLVLNIMLSLAVIAGVISLLTPPTYEAETSIRIKQPKSLANSLLSDLPLGGQTNIRQKMATYAEILQGRTVVQAVIDATQADKEVSPTYEDMLKRISVQPVKDTEILKVRVRASSPTEAQVLTNTLVETFITRMTNLVRGEETAVREFIGERLQESKRELEKAEGALEAYRRNEKIIAPTEETKSIVDRLAAINSLAANNAVALASSQAKLASIGQQISSQNPGFIADSPLIQQLKGKLADLEVELVGLKQNYTGKHPKVIAAQAAIAETKAKLNNEIARVINAEAPSMNPVHQAMLQAKIQSEAELAANQAQRAAIDRIMAQGEQDLAKLPSKEQGYARLMRDVLISQEIYSMLAKRNEEARISEVMQPTDVQIIDVAVIPERPISPRKALNTIAAAVFGLVFGTALAFILEYRTGKIRSEDDVQHYLNLPVLGSIPDYGSSTKAGDNGGTWSKLKVRFGL